MVDQPTHSETDDSDELFERHTIQVDPGQSPLRIDKFLGDRLQNVTRNKIQSAIREGYVKVNGDIIKPNYKVRPLDSIMISLPEPPRDTDVVPENISLEIEYEDNDISMLRGCKCGSIFFLFMKSQKDADQVKNIEKELEKKLNAGPLLIDHIRMKQNSWRSG